MNVSQNSGSLLALFRICNATRRDPALAGFGSASNAELWEDARTVPRETRPGRVN